MTGLPFADPYRSGGRHEEALHPASASGSGGAGGLGALARSASLGARKKDPYAYSSDDVESGLGSMDMSGGERGWGFGGSGAGVGGSGLAERGVGGPGAVGFGRGQTQTQPQGYGAEGGRGFGAAAPPLASASRGAHASNLSQSHTAAIAGPGSMGPPPPPVALSSRPTAGRNDSGGSASSASTSLNSPYAPPTAQMVQHQQQQQQQRVGQGQYNAFNPYVPRGSDPGPSKSTNAVGGSTAPGSAPAWEYPAPRDRLPSNASYHSHHSHHSHQSELSPFTTSEDRVPSPASPFLNPYDRETHSLGHAGAHAHTHPSSSPMSGSGGGSGMTSPWSSTAYGASPDGTLPLFQQHSSAHANNLGQGQGQGLGAGRPNGGARSHSTHQVYAASQPSTPAGKYELGPPPRGAREQRSRSLNTVGSGRGQGFREVHDWQDLRPVMNERPAGRRPDPVRPGKYLSPLQCLTQGLPQTYTLCNPQFRYESSDNPRRVLTKPSKPVHNDGADNEDWDYILYVNDVLGGEDGRDRYLILDVLGQGTFGQVVKCQNIRTHDIVAVKVVKNKPAYLNQSKMEVAILDILNNTYDPHDQHHILRMLDHFTHKSHLCLVFECLSSNLYELIKQNQFKGLSLQLVKVFTGQLLECLAVLKDARLIHCDLKPENILLKTLQSPQIKIIDFGSACLEAKTVYTYIQSRFYRSPEVLLGLPYSTSIDMWSLGCIVVELFLGLPLFPGTSEYNQIWRIVDMLGNPPSHLLDVGKQTHEFFNFAGVDNQGRKQYQLKSMEQYASEHRTNEQPSKQYFKQTKLDDIVMQYAYSKKNPKQSDIDKEMAQRTAFVDFVKGLLNLDPIKRWSPQQAAKHPFLTGERFTGPYQPSNNTAKKSYPPTPAESPTTPSKNKYGGLQQQSSPSRTNRVQSDAGIYHQQAPAAYGQPPIQASRQHSAAAYSPSYDTSGHRARIPSQSQAVQQQSAAPSSGQWQSMGPPIPFQSRVPSQGMGASVSHSSLRPSNHGAGNPPVSAGTNPPPNSYYPASRNRANTINQMDAIPPALARLTHMSMPDPSGQRNLTPVLNRGDDAYREWERRQQGHSKKSSMAHTSYPQLEYLQEQAELAAMGLGGGWVMPAAMGHGYAPVQGYGVPPQGQGQGHGHRAKGSMSVGGGGAGQMAQGYQMQPPIGMGQPAPGGSGVGGSPYDPPNAGGNRAYLPAFPPPAATASHPLGHGHGLGHGHSLSHGGGGQFDPFDAAGGGVGGGGGMMYAPLQPSFAPHAQGQGQGGGPGHGSSASASMSMGASSSYHAIGSGYASPGAMGPVPPPSLGVHGHGAHGMGHQTRASFSGPFSPGAGAGGAGVASGNPFASAQLPRGGSSPRYAAQQGQGQGQQQNQRRSGQYGA